METSISEHLHICEFTPKACSPQKFQNSTINEELQPSHKLEQRLGLRQLLTQELCSLHLTFQGGAHLFFQKSQRHFTPPGAVCSAASQLPTSMTIGKQVRSKIKALIVRTNIRGNLKQWQH